MTDILVIIPYHNRPDLLRHALRSVVESHPFDGTWAIALHDDASYEEVAGEPIAREVLGPLADRCRFSRCEDTPARPHQLGQRLNEILLASTEDIALVLCDDDMLCEDYLAGLSAFFAARPEAAYCYSQSKFMDADGEVMHDAWGFWNLDWEGDGDIDPTFRCDISQVAWRTQCNRDGVLFPAWAEKNHDTEFFRQMYLKYGKCLFTGMPGQCKRIHEGQLAFKAAEMDIDALVTEAKEASCRFFDAGEHDLAERLLVQALSVKEDAGCRELLELVRESERDRTTLHPSS